MTVTEETEDELMTAVQIELDKAVTKQVCDAVYEAASLPPEERTNQVLDSECRTRKDVIMDVISNSVNLQRLYFIVRSSLMGLITGALTFLFVSFFGITNFWFLVFIGLIIFIVSLIISRVLDKPVVKISTMAVMYLKRHKRLKAIVLERL